MSEAWRAWPTQMLELLANAGDVGRLEEGLDAWREGIRGEAPSARELLSRFAGTRLPGPLSASASWAADTLLAMACSKPEAACGAVAARFALEVWALAEPERTEALADPSRRGRLPRTPMGSAVALRGGDGVGLRMIEALLAAGGDPQEADVVGGQTPLMVACEFRREPIAARLMGLGGADRQDRLGMTPLMRALAGSTREQEPEMSAAGERLAIALAPRSDLRLEDIHGHTALDWAIDNQRMGALPALLDLANEALVYGRAGARQQSSWDRAVALAECGASSEAERLIGAWSARREGEGLRQALAGARMQKQGKAKKINRRL
jgi:hypothetical protein